jgi:5-methylcytosine-specific restriction endonuclease McrA
MKTAKRKAALFARDPHCHWCGKLTVLIPASPGRRRFYENEATVDHLYPRFNPARHIPRPPGEQRTVLACRECNDRRNVEAERALPAGELQRRARNFPAPSARGQYRPE